MKYSPFLLIPVFFAFTGCKKRFSSEQTVSSITTLPMHQVALEDLSGFESVTSNWQIAGRVVSDYNLEQDLTIQGGTGVLVNQVKDQNNEHLITSWEHGDLELDLEFMIPKGSNSGIYFQGRYEIQLFDSWKVDQPQHSDCGGIYERWNENAAPGQQGFEGHAPSLNACLAPGLWQHLYVKFTAPRFDEQGRKIENARFDKVILNGLVIHQDVMLSGPTRAAVASDEVARAPLMLQGDHGNVAFRKIYFKRYFDQPIKVADLQYQYYELEMSAAMPDFDTLTPIETGNIDSFAIDKIAKRDNFFGIRFTGTIQVPVDGNYVFHTISDDGSKLYLNDQLLVSNDFNHDMERQSGSILLQKGEHNLRVDYYNNQWGKGLAVLYEGPEIEYQTLNSTYQQEQETVKDPLLLDPGAEPELLRGFVNFRGEKRTHAISVGDPLGVNYSVDLKSGNLLKCWRGGFADVTNMWQDRGYSQLVIPQTLAVELTDGVIAAELASQNSVYPNSANEDLKPEGYRIDIQGRPVFQYQLGETFIEDRYIPVRDGERLERQLQFSTDNGTMSNLYTRLGAADYIELLNNGLYTIGGLYYLEIVDSESTPFIRDNGGMAELMIPITGSSSVKYDLLW